MGPIQLLRVGIQRYLHVPLVWRFAVALVLGAIVGLIFAPDQLTWLSPLGELFLRLLQMVIIPVVLFTLTAGLANVEPGRLGRIGSKIMVYYLITSAVAIIIGMLIALLVVPGAGLRLPADSGAPPEDPPPLSEVLLNIVPSNPVAAMAEGNVLAVVFIAILIGLCASQLRGASDERLRGFGRGLWRVFEAGAAVTNMVVKGVLHYGPVGVFALVATALAELGMDAVAALGKLVGVVYSGIAVQLVLYALLLLAFRVNLRGFAVAARLPLLTGFVTRSSTGTLPVTLRSAEQMGVDRSTFSFTLPVGATINMDGTALYIGASVVFAANLAGVDLSIGDLIGVVVVATLASIGTVAVPGAGLIMLGVALQQAGLPFAAIALIAGVDAFLDMGRTMCNIAGDLTGTRVVAATEAAPEKQQTDAAEKQAATAPEKQQERVQE